MVVRIGIPFCIQRWFFEVGRGQPNPSASGDRKGTVCGLEGKGGGSALIVATSVCVHRAAVIVMKSIVKNKGGVSEKGCPSKVETYYA